MSMRNQNMNTVQVQADERYPIEDLLNIHDSSFRRHYQLNYSDGSLDYESVYAPAYRYGFTLSEQNPDAEWHQVEAEAKAKWTPINNVSWQMIAEAVRYGWTEERNPAEHRVEH